MNNLITNLVFLLFIFCAAVFPQENVSFLILQNPLQVTIFDKYEQALDENQKKYFLPYSPFLIVRRSAVLGDQITKAVEFKFRDDSYYILKNDKGGFVGDSKDHYKKLFVNAVEVNDTVEILENDALKMYEIYPLQGEQTYLKKNDMVIRVFKYEKVYYILHNGQKPEYGWCRLEPKKAWKKVIEALKPVEQVSGETGEVFQSIIDRMQGVNNIYAQYFAYFNKKTALQKSVPRWECAIQGDILTCTLKGIVVKENLEESTRYLKQEVENILIGKSFSVSHQSGVIRIQGNGISSEPGIKN
jgi:hypothetical protein